jgi:hypothetical protein
VDAFVVQRDRRADLLALEHTRVVDGDPHRQARRLGKREADASEQHERRGEHRELWAPDRERADER